MRTVDLSPLYRTGIGFDRLVRMLDMNLQQDTGYPPYNIEAIEDNRYEISLAVAGFKKDELEIVSENNTLVISSKKRNEEKERQYLHQGIAYRAFERKFQLADYVQVVGAELENGLLRVSLVREIPEAMKPRAITIETKASAQDPKLVEQKDKDAA